MTQNDVFNQKGEQMVKSILSQAPANILENIFVEGADI